MADYYKDGIKEMLEDMSDEELAYYYTLIAKSVWG